MPGLVGIAGHPRASATVRDMLDAVTHTPQHQPHEIFESGHFSASLCSVVGEPDHSYASRDGIHVWVDGEIYSVGQDQEIENPKEDTAELLLDLYRADREWLWLPAVNGLFCFALYDENTGRLYLATDRYGLQHLFYSQNETSIVWTSEVKAYARVPDVPKTKNTEAIDHFIENGQFPENETWFRELKLLGPGRMLEIELSTLKIKDKQYWSWADIPQEPDTNGLAEKIESAFIRSVDRRCRGSKSIGLGLSGGLDSRLILAALSELNKASDSVAVTFGVTGSEEIRIAQKCAEIDNTHHHVEEINDDAWLERREEAVWWTDGQTSIQHLHIADVSEPINSLYKVHLCGYLGDVVLGGTYFARGDEKATMNERGRRFIIQGTRCIRAFAYPRCVFFDNDIIELVYSRPERIRKLHRLYAKVVSLKFKPFFGPIEWAGTGHTLIPWWKYYGRVRCSGLVRRLRRLVGVKNKKYQSAIPYSQWLGKKPSLNRLRDTLTTHPQLFREADRVRTITHMVDQYNSDSDFSNKLLAHYTAEVFWRRLSESTAD